MDQAVILDRVKIRIDPSGDIGADLNELLAGIITDVSSQLGVRLGTEEVPTELEYIVVAVTVKNYNRIGSEGTASHTVEGETMSWSEDPFTEFADDISSWQSRHAIRRSHCRFI